MMSKCEESLTKCFKTEGLGDRVLSPVPFGIKISV